MAIKTCRIFIVLPFFLFACMDASYAAQAAFISGARISSAQIAVPSLVTDPCAGKSIGQACDGTLALYGGTNYANLVPTDKYMVTPGGCAGADLTHPTCAGGANNDTVILKWANNSGTTAYNVVTGAASETDGVFNTNKLTTLSPFYTDTDAAKYCQDMVYSGYNDWYLPAKKEVNDVLYNNKDAIKGFSTYYYWSSTETSGYGAEYQYFSNASQGTTGKTDLFAHIRCVRKY
jgi:hypothetical protein